MNSRDPRQIAEQFGVQIEHNRPDIESIQFQFFRRTAADDAAFYVRCNRRVFHNDTQRDRLYSIRAEHIHVDTCSRLVECTQYSHCILDMDVRRDSRRDTMQLVVQIFHGCLVPPIRRSKKKLPCVGGSLFCRNDRPFQNLDVGFLAHTNSWLEHLTSHQLACDVACGLCAVHSTELEEDGQIGQAVKRTLETVFE